MYRVLLSVLPLVTLAACQPGGGGLTQACSTIEQNTAAMCSCLDEVAERELSDDDYGALVAAFEDLAAAQQAPAMERMNKAMAVQRIIGQSSALQRAADQECGS